MTDQIVDNEITQEKQAPVVLLFYTDLFFGVQLQSMAQKAGLRPVTVRPAAPLPAAKLLVVDMGAHADWEPLIREARSKGTEVVAFGSHMDAEARMRAKEAGASRVLANSNLARDLPLILKGIKEAGG